MATYTEPFTGANGTTPAGWTNRIGSIVIQGNEGAGNTAWDFNVATYTGATYGPHQYAKATIKTLSTRSFGVGVRCTGTSYDGYWFYWDGTSTVTIRRGLVTVLQTITSVTLAASDVIEIRAAGTTLSVWKNGTQLGTDQTDGTYQTGSGGIFINHTTPRLDDFETGDYGSVTDTVDCYLDFESGTDGDTVSAAILAASVHPTPPWGTVARSGAFTSTTIEADGERALPGPVTVGQVEYADASGSRGYKRNHNEAVESIQVRWPQGTKDVVSVGFWLYTTFPVGGTTPHTLANIIADGSEFVGLSFAPNNLAYLPIGCETVGGNTYGSGTQINTGTWYWITMQYDRSGGTGRLAIYNTAGAQVGATIEASLIATPPATTGFDFGETAAHSDPVVGYSLYDDVIVDWTDGTFPLLPTVAASFKPAWAARQPRTIGAGVM